MKLHFTYSQFLAYRSRVEGVRDRTWAVCVRKYWKERFGNGKLKQNLLPYSRRPSKDPNPLRYGVKGEYGE